MLQTAEGNSTEEKTVQEVGALISGSRGFVSLDSDHRKEHVLNELLLYGEFVGLGSYIVVEDTNINGNPVRIHFEEGPKRGDRRISQDKR